MKNFILVLIFISCSFANVNDDFKSIKEDMQRALEAYKIKDISNATELVLYARHHGYRNSGLEYKIQTQISKEKAQHIIKKVSDIIRAIQSKKDIEEITAISDSFLHEIESCLPLLQEGNVNIVKRDWFKITKKIIKKLNQAKDAYRQKRIKQAIVMTQDVYFDIFEGSGFEKAILNLSEDRKVKAEERFRELTDLFKQNSDISSIELMIEDINNDLNKLSAQLLPEEKNKMSNIYIYGFIVLLFAIFMILILIKKMKANKTQ